MNLTGWPSRDAFVHKRAIRSIASRPSGRKAGELVPAVHHPVPDLEEDVDACLRRLVGESAPVTGKGLARPYRDIRGYNFPGHIYLHWILGKLFGWGHPGVFYAVDAMALLVLGAAILAWSRRCFGLLLPGITGYLIFLGYYLDIHFEMVAERDWHAALAATLGLLRAPGLAGTTRPVVISTPDRCGADDPPACRLVPARPGLRGHDERRCGRKSARHARFPSQRI